MSLKISKLTKDLPDLEYATQGSVGLDIRYAYTQPIIIQPNTHQLIPTGISIEIPSEYEAQIRSRSGLAKKHSITVFNAPATIDSDYRGEIMVLLRNSSDTDFTVTQHMRIAQMIIAKIEKPTIQYVEQLSPTDRGDKGFGSTGLFNQNKKP